MLLTNAPPRDEARGSGRLVCSHLQAGLKVEKGWDSKVPTAERAEDSGQGFSLHSS
jgi:hypothetical protein